MGLCGDRVFNKVRTCKHPSQSFHDQACQQVDQAWRQGDDSRGLNHAFADQRQLRRTQQLDEHAICRQTRNK